MKLNDTTIRNARACDSKNRRLTDGSGLYLEVTPKGKKWWRFRYRFAGREKCISFGVYPPVKLKTARQRKNDVKELLAKSVDPSQQRKIDKLQRAGSDQNTFEAVAVE